MGYLFKLEGDKRRLWNFIDFILLENNILSEYVKIGNALPWN